MHVVPCKSTRGFSLIEALVASVLVASALVVLAQLVSTAAQQALRSRRATSALTIAQSKLEQLRRVAWSFTADGSRLSSPALTLSPAQSLTENAVGYVDYLDAFGERVAPGTTVPSYVRRWSIALLSASDLDTLLIHVCVLAMHAVDVAEVTPTACVSGIRTRKP